MVLELINHNENLFLQNYRSNDSEFTHCMRSQIYRPAHKNLTKRTPVIQTPTSIISSVTFQLNTNLPHGTKTQFVYQNTHWLLI